MHVLELRNSLHQYLTEERHSSAHMFMKYFNMCILSSVINEPHAANTSLQECVNNILQVNGKLKLFS
jgi:hypothetical protein